MLSYSRRDSVYIEYERARQLVRAKCEVNTPYRKRVLMRNANLVFVVIGMLSFGCSSQVASSNENEQPIDAEAESPDDSSSDLSRGSEPATGPALRAVVDPSTSRVAAADKEWSFVDVPESRCANGTSTGFGINPASGSDELMVYFEGGGACWNAATCGIGTSANIRTGYTSSEFDKDGARDWAIFSRTEPKNPFRNMNHVIVPYCTADVHAGTKTTDYGLFRIVHNGASNVDEMLLRLKATYPNLRRLVVVGTSAGGFGAQLNYPRFAATFPSTKIDLVADGAQMLTPKGSLRQEWSESWGLRTPNDCTGCLEKYPNYVTYLLRKYPNANFALFASMRDIVLTPFFNFGIDVQSFRDETAELLVNRYDLYPNGRYLARRWFRHGYLEGVKQVASNENKESFAFLAEFLAGTAVSKRPF
jgi:hypothetical protein